MNLTVQAPAKINLTLEVLGKRDDGFHELRSVIQTIDLCDTFHFEPSEKTVFSSDSAEWDGEKSLVAKAVRLFSEAIGRSDGVSIHVEKRIPMMAGLGGDSSDAAAVLRTLDVLWDTGLPLEKLHALAEQLGSDVPFFLYGGTALLEGRGEKVIPLDPAPSKWVVLVVPNISEVPGKTGRLFGGLLPEMYLDGSLTSQFIEGIQTSDAVPDVFNVFEKVAFSVYPGLQELSHTFEHLAGNDVYLAGSGPVLFTLVADKGRAEDICDNLTGEGMRAVLCKTLKELPEIRK